LVERYTQGPGIDEPLVGQRQPKIFYYGADGLGSITSLTDPTGAVAATYTYDSFGFMTASTGSATNWFRYTARQFDSSTALYYYRARYYDPMTGRFLSEDPIRFSGADMNVFRFVRNKPTGFVDRMGLLVIDPNFRSDCLPALQRALDIVRRTGTENTRCDCAFRQIGSHRSLSDLVVDPNITIRYSPHDIYSRGPGGRITAVVAGYTYPYDTQSLFIKPFTCRMGRWELASTLVHELVHITRGAVPGDPEDVAENIERTCGLGE
jgi:RHS repeat-associated protein